MNLDLLEVIAVVTVIQLLTLSIFLVSYKKTKQISNKILAAFLFINSLSIIEFLFWRLREYIYPRFPHVFFTGSLFVFLWGPSIYFYTKSMTNRNIRFKKRDSVHFIPFLIFSFYMILDFHLLSADAKREVLISNEAWNFWEKIIINISLHIQILTYLTASVLTLRNYRKKIKEYFSSIERIRLSWMNLVLIGFISIWLIDLVYFSLWRTRYSYLGEALNFISLTITFIFANVIVYKGLNYPEVLSGVEAKKLNMSYERPSLTKREEETYLKELMTYMEEKKPYLMPLLTIDELANKLSIPTRKLSLLINDSLNKNFFDFINSYRVEEAKRILTDPSINKKTILQILFDAGFNSKPSFNRVFKKHTGKSPSEFKKTHQR